MQYILPKLTNENDFEDLVRDVFALEFRNPNLQRYGRRGQKQDGIDIVGITGINQETGRPTVIQCKNHTLKIDDTDLIKEIDDELERFDRSNFKDSDYFFVTSADNSKPVLDHCNTLTKLRRAERKPAVEIRFWDEISGKALKSRDILYTYYARMFPFMPPDTLTLPDEGLKYRDTLRICLSDLLDDGTLAQFKKDALATCRKNLGIPEGSNDRYHLYLGIFTNPRADFNGQVDIEIDASSFVDGTCDLEGRCLSLKRSLVRLVEALHNPFYSPKIYIRSDMEVNIALFLGRVLRKGGFELNVSFKDMLFSSNGRTLASVPSGVQENFVRDINGSSLADDCVFVFSSALGTNITNDVVRYVGRWEKPILFRSYYIADGRIQNSAHAVAVAADICGKLHSLQFQGVKRIHVFFAVPKPLAMLIGHGLNTLNTEMHLYFMSPDRTAYLCTGALDNNTFGGSGV